MILLIKGMDKLAMRKTFDIQATTRESLKQTCRNDLFENHIFLIILYTLFKTFVRMKTQSVKHMVLLIFVTLFSFRSVAQIQDANRFGTFTDSRDGHEYGWVKIGKQVWMAENLRTGKLNDGTTIPLVTNNTAWNRLTPACCWYNNDKATFGNTYGALYNWWAVNTGKLCPAGWHVPTDEEWTTLTTFLRGESVAGVKMKESGTTHWKSPNKGATNESGFCGLPVGYRYYTGDFNYVGSYGYWWSSTKYATKYARSRRLGYNSAVVNRDIDLKGDGFSVRCLRDN